MSDGLASVGASFKGGTFRGVLERIVPIDHIWLKFPGLLFECEVKLRVFPFFGFVFVVSIPGCVS